MADRSWRVLGALGPGAYAPLLAEQHWAGAVRQVVLARPLADAALPVVGCHSPRVCTEEDRVDLDGRTYGIQRYAPGLDVGQLLDALGDGVPPAALAELAVQVLEALDGCPVVHGGLGPGRIRVDAVGWVRLVGFTGRATDDRAELRDLVEDWGDLPDAVLDAIAAGDLAAVRNASLPGPSLAELVAPLEAPPLFAHDLAGQTLSEQAAAPSVPPKARTAAIAALTLVLGLLSAWFYAT